MSDAVAWHDANAARFAARYAISPAFRERLAIWETWIARHAPAGCQLLDAGCGSGILSVAAAPRAGRVLAFDASPMMVRLARESAEAHANVAVVQGRIGDPDLADDRRFDIALCSSVLEYCEDLDASLAWLRHRLATQAVLLVSMPNGDSLYRRAERVLFGLTGRPAYYATVRHVITPRAMQHRLQASGFEPFAMQTFAAAPVISRPMRALRLERFSDTLTLFACRTR